MIKTDITIRRLKKTSFSNVYADFLLNKDLDRGKYIKILALATLFINSENEEINRLGYRMVVLYSNQTGDYNPLYEIAINLGLVPVAKFIEKFENEKEGNIFTELNAARTEDFFVNNVYCSIQQKELIDFYEKNVDETLSIVAPTSYGKTDLIISTLKKCQNKNICIITPTKSLLAQTKMRVIKSKIRWIKKIITHPEMYNGNEDNLVAILTQERLLRLLKQSDNIVFDYVIIDEAHGLLHDDDRNLLLASVLLVLEKRNRETAFKFLTPFLCEPQNLKVKYADYKLEAFKINEYIKTEKLFVVELRSDKKREYSLYDQFMNQFYELPINKEIKDEIDFIVQNYSSKNIIYFNKPKDIEQFVEKLCKRFERIHNKYIDKICEDIAEYVHPEYRMLECLKHGVVYHHGSVPESVRIFIEHLYSDVKDIRYVVTSSTLLEGVNLPAEKMFLLDNKKGRGNLSPSNFKNLIGRVCRFSQIFNKKTGSLKRLEPAIYLVAGKSYSKNANIHKFIQTTMNIEKKTEDELKNVLLENTEISNDNKERLETAEEFVENYEDGVIEKFNLRKTHTQVGKSCFINNITEFNIFENEEEMSKHIEGYKDKMYIIENTQQLFDVLADLFFINVEDSKIARFEYIETRKFYKMFMDWRISNASLNEMITSFVRYWNSLIKEKKDTLVFVGRWGDTVRNGIKELWTDISKKNEREKVNLAIVRIKEEQDFLDNTIIKFVEVLNDVQLMENDLYLKIKYGTCDLEMIVLLKNGISLSLAKLLTKKYKSFLEISIKNNTVNFKEGILEIMRDNGENEVIIYEIQYFGINI